MEQELRDELIRELREIQTRLIEASSALESVIEQDDDSERRRWARGCIIGNIDVVTSGRLSKFYAGDFDNIDDWIHWLQHGEHPAETEKGNSA